MLSRSQVIQEEESHGHGYSGGHGHGHGDAGHIKIIKVLSSVQRTAFSERAFLLCMSRYQIFSICSRQIGHRWRRRSWIQWRSWRSWRPWRSFGRPNCCQHNQSGRWRWTRRPWWTWWWSWRPWRWTLWWLPSHIVESAKRSRQSWSWWSWSRMGLSISAFRIPRPTPSTVDNIHNTLGFDDLKLIFIDRFEWANGHRKKNNNDHSHFEEKI